MPRGCARFFACFLLVIVASESLVMSSTSLKQKVAVVGATGKLGREVVQKLVSAGVPVRCLVRTELPPAAGKTTNKLAPDATSTQVAQYLQSLQGVELIKGDVTDLPSLKKLIEGCTSCMAVYGARRMSKISDLWNKNVETEPGHAKLVNYDGIVNLIQAVQESKTCQRIVRVSGKGEDPWSFFTILINMLGSMAKAWNYEGEQLLRNSTVDYTIIRPGIMKQEDEEVGKKVLALKDNGGSLKVSTVPYATIADLCVECLDYPNTARSTLCAMDVPDGEGEATYAPLLAKVKPDTRQFPSSLIQDHRRAVRATIAVLMAVSVSMAAGFLKVVQSVVKNFVSFR